MYGIWSFNDDGWLKEDNGIAILVFEHESQARNRAAKHYGYDKYEDVTDDGWCIVKIIRENK